MLCKDTAVPGGNFLAASCACLSCQASSAGAPQRRVRYKPRLTAASYRYFLRGASEKAAADDYRVAARRRVRLAPFDRALRQFKCGSTAHLQSDLASICIPI
jgi:hypothetical protein